MTFLERLYAEAEECGQLEIFLSLLASGHIVVMNDEPEDQEVTNAFIEKIRHERHLS